MEGPTGGNTGGAEGAIAGVHAPCSEELALGACSAGSARRCIGSAQRVALHGTEELLQGQHAR
eukprot:1223905-Prorocentrum_lima.AAC.1